MLNIGEIRVRTSLLLHFDEVFLAKHLQRATRPLFRFSSLNHPLVFTRISAKDIDNVVIRFALLELQEPVKSQAAVRECPRIPPHQEPDSFEHLAELRHIIRMNEKIDVFGRSNAPVNSNRKSAAYRISDIERLQAANNLIKLTEEIDGHRRPL